MKKLLIIIIVLLMLSSLVFAKLSDETLKEVDKLRFKHYPFICTTDDSIFYDPIEYEWISMTFEDGKLYVETQDGKWFIEMEKITKETEEAIE